MICFLQSCNPQMAKETLGILLFRDGIVTWNLSAALAERDGHSKLFLPALQKEGFKVEGWSLCQCGHCWVSLIESAKGRTKEIQQILVETAYASCKKSPPTLDQLVTMPLCPPPPLPYLRDYADLARRYKAFPEFKCGRMVYEGNQRTSV